ncbi:MAG TPA: aldehyde dehydrogenase family protein [Candidatus Stercorousia faecigallinarum]|nr:aldehyde dehydrogenase family protein [Candidatus Stercorousia faecigallinarum]
MIDDIAANLKEFFNTNRTKDVSFRIKQLKNLKDSIKHYEPEIVQALRDDLRKSDFEIYTTEIGFVLKELDYTIKYLKKWAKTERVSTPVYLKPSNAYVVKEPYGVALIIVPFNYPFQLAFVPLIGAVAAGNCAVVKPSKRTPRCTEVICRIIAQTFSDNYVKCILPTEMSSSELLSGDFDYMFFTGSTQTGKLVAEAAAKKLIPYTLELGGKSPVIVDKNANLEQAARKIAWGKFLNSGQTCIAPDFVLVHEDVKQELVNNLISSIKSFYGVFAQESKDYGRIIDTDAFRRLEELIAQEAQNIIYGGETDECGLYIEPTLLSVDTYDCPSMQEEIFGPVLPIMTYINIDSVIDTLRNKPKPLALYVFSKDKEFYWKVIKSLSFGGGAVNDTIQHTTNVEMPFGGIGYSGVGRYHGKYTFDAFTHLKSILVRNPEIDMNIMYPPYSFDTVKKVRKFFG